MRPCELVTAETMQTLYLVYSKAGWGLGTKLVNKFICQLVWEADIMEDGYHLAQFGSLEYKKTMVILLHISNAVSLNFPRAHKNRRLK